MEAVTLTDEPQGIAAAPVAAPLQRPAGTDPIPLPQDAHSFLLSGILVLLTFYTLYFARDFVMPLLFAFMLKLLLQPAMRALGKLKIPAIVSAFLMIVLLFGTLTLLVSSLATPAAGWLGKLPQTLPRIEQRLSSLKAPLDRIQQASEEVGKLAAPPPKEGGATPVVVEGPGLGGLLVTSTRAFLTGLLETVVVLFFLLIAGDLFLRKMVEVLPRFQDKKQAVAISQEIERNISAYLVTISIMNLLVGMAVAVTAWFAGLGDPVLWGAVGFLLNYVPILGPLAGIVIFFIAGLLSFDTMWQGALVAGIYLAIHLLEGEVVTPMLVARRFTLNPVLVIVSLIFWYWMWGVLGAIIAVPLLATVKIICDHVRPLMALGHFLSG